MNILSMQSWVAAGHVGNAAALFPLQRLGAEVMGVHTVQFSNHPGHGRFGGEVFSAAHIAAVVEGLEAHGALARCDAVLSGYVGDAALGAVILDAVGRTRAARPDTLWCCDPVMGDHGRLYVRPDIAEFFAARAVPAADILVPNQFEFELLAGTPAATLADAVRGGTALRQRLRAGGPRILLISSLELAEFGGDIGVLLLCDAGAFRLRVTRLPVRFNGAGDTLAALFLFHSLAGLAPPAAASRALGSLAGLLRRTFEAGSGELLTVAAQDEFVAPSVSVDAVRV